MPTFFRWRTPLGVGWRRARFFPATAPALRPAVFAMSGAATVPEVSIAIFNAVLASAGVGALPAVGAGIISGVLSSAGVASASYAGQPFFTSVFSMAGTATADFVKGLGQIVSTNMIQKPVNAVLMGQQNDEKFKKGRATPSALRNIFGE